MGVTKVAIFKYLSYKTSYTVLLIFLWVEVGVGNFA